MPPPLHLLLVLMASWHGVSISIEHNARETIGNEPALCHSAIPTSHYIFNVYKSCLCHCFSSSYTLVTDQLSSQVSSVDVRSIESLTQASVQVPSENG